MAAAATSMRRPGAWQLGGRAQAPCRPCTRRARAAPIVTCQASSQHSLPVAAAAIATVPRSVPHEQQTEEQHKHHRHHHHHHHHYHQQQPPRSANGRLLDAPAHLSAFGQASCKVHDAGGPVSLETYMRLPVEQYYILDPSQIRFLESNRFQLAVPRINLLGASLEPTIEVAVTSKHDAVVLHSASCQLKGTGALGPLDDKFSMAFTTVITWQSATAHDGNGGDSGGGGGSAAGAAAAVVSGVDAKGPGSNAWRSLRNGLQQLGGVAAGSGCDGSEQGAMTGSASIEVFCEVIPPFNLMPREALEHSCNAVIGGLVRSLLPVFMRQLAADYKRWAADEAYRQERAARSKPLS